MLLMVDKQHQGPKVTLLAAVVSKLPKRYPHKYPLFLSLEAK